MENKTQGGFKWNSITKNNRCRFVWQWENQGFFAGACISFQSFISDCVRWLKKCLGWLFKAPISLILEGDWIIRHIQ